jgi:hypothetical protein
VLRVAPDGGRVLALTNVTDREQVFARGGGDLGGESPEWRDLLLRRRWPASAGGVEVRLPPYGVAWLVPG